jgi:hypothetical protein
MPRFGLTIIFGNSNHTTILEASTPALAAIPANPENRLTDIFARLGSL